MHINPVFRLHNDHQGVRRVPDSRIPLLLGVILGDLLPVTFRDGPGNAIDFRHRVDVELTHSLIQRFENLSVALEGT